MWVVWDHQDAVAGVCVWTRCRLDDDRLYEYSKARGDTSTVYAVSEHRHPPSPRLPLPSFAVGGNGSRLRQAQAALSRSILSTRYSHQFSYQALSRLIAGRCRPVTAATRAQRRSDPADGGVGGVAERLRGWLMAPSATSLPLRGQVYGFCSVLGLERCFYRGSRSLCCVLGWSRRYSTRVIGPDD